MNIHAHRVTNEEELKEDIKTAKEEVLQSLYSNMIRPQNGDFVTGYTYIRVALWASRGGIVEFSKSDILNSFLFPRVFTHKVWMRAF